jgi:drug/metabolite transporter (DMT)-like permease
MLGILTGFAGALLLAYGDGDEKNTQISNAWYVVAATVCYAISVNMIKKYLSDVGSLRATVWAFMFTGPMATVYLFSTDFMEVLNNHPRALSSVGYIAILGVVGSALAVIAFNELIKLSGPVFASTTTYLIPMVAVAWGLYDKEHITWMQVMAAVVILAGIWLINIRKKSSR